jgi:putative membrane protein
MTMWLDAVLAYFHYVAIFMLFAYLVAESMMIKRPLDAAAILRLAKIDLIYGGLAAAVLVTGFLRLAYGAKGAEFYMQSWPVYVKIGLFLFVGMISIYPTLAFGRWRRNVRHDPAWKVPPDEQGRIRKVIFAELHLAGMIPVFAVIMSRGLAA